MQQQPDDFRDSFYYKVIRTKLGQALRNAVTEPMPERLVQLLRELEARLTREGGGSPTGHVRWRAWPAATKKRRRTIFGVRRLMRGTLINQLAAVQ
jgi:hypothetical protein